MSGLFLRLRRSILYLMEPLLAFFAAAALVVVLQPHSPQMPVRLVELHAQDVLSVMQAEGDFEKLASGNLSEQYVGTLVHALNPNYGWQIELSDGHKLGEAPRGETVSASRDFVRDGRFFTIKLNMFYE